MINLLYATMMPRIDHLAHIGGFIGGMGMSYIFGPRLYRTYNNFGHAKIIDVPIISVKKINNDIKNYFNLKIF